jgi:hypothetical protein
MKRQKLRISAILLIAGLLASSGFSRLAAQENGDIPEFVTGEDTFIELTPDSEEAIRRGLAHLASIQLPDGSFPSSYGSNMGITSLALLSFLAAGHVPGQGDYGHVLERGLDFVIGHASPSGLITCEEAVSHGPMYEHALATLFLSEVDGMTDRTEIPSILQAAVRVIVNSQNDEGGWRYQPHSFDADISVTVMQIVALRGAKNAGINVPRETIAKAIGYVKSCAHESGGFTYQAHGDEPGYARTGAGVTSLEVAGDYTSDEVRRGLDYLIAEFKPDSTDRYYYAYYYSAQAIYQAKDPRRWRQWFPRARDSLLGKRLPEGQWVSEYGTSYGTAMAILVLAVPYRYLPIYQR